MFDEQNDLSDYQKKIFMQTNVFHCAFFSPEKRYIPLYKTLSTCMAHEQLCIISTSLFLNLEQDHKVSKNIEIPWCSHNLSKSLFSGRLNNLEI